MHANTAPKLPTISYSNTISQFSQNALGNTTPIIFQLLDFFFANNIFNNNVDHYIFFNIYYFLCAIILPTESTILLILAIELLKRSFYNVGKFVECSIIIINDDSGDLISCITLLKVSL